MSSSTPSVAMLGLGLIGTAWANNLRADNVALRTWNRTPKATPDFVADAGEAAEAADFVFICVADPPAVESVLDAIESRLRAGQTVVQTSTISPEWTLRFAERVEKTGASFLEAPFTGSKPVAEVRQTVFYLGGEEELIEKARPVLKHLSKAVLHIGPTGSASAIKLAMNLNVAAVTVALCESLTFCRRNGISDDTFFDALKQNASHSGLADLKEPKLRERNYEPQFSIKHMAKDLRLALETAESQGELPLTQAVRDFYGRGLDAGMAEDDFAGLIRLIEKPGVG